ncbi:helix-turn-helix transcriptional regulator [Cryobacterium sp. CG_9.6]|uniref:helix-turn-helix domain-containing protein n=1 Tax=Cryobacterium sp. CG_9.6 TaxID=2760710 RepID=UPI0024770CFE|nr:helix-turn-helix transcriptional regulator [Cryobacterium sp. CG_9.6]MDH6238360.1 transcriptional regulator with XRE-family HTH domain [Cryobacterium sp. CG_9.6]
MNTTKIVQLRLDHGWTQDRLATTAGVGLRTIQRLEAGHEASLETLSLVAFALRVSVRDLYSEIDDAVLRDRVEFFDARVAEEQSARERIEKGWRWLYVGIGVVITVVSINFPLYAATVFFSYWIGGYMILVSVRRIYLEPRLQKDYPRSMSKQQIRARRDSAKGSWRVREENATEQEGADSRPPMS